MSTKDKKGAGGCVGESGDDDCQDFSGHFDITKLNEHLRVCLRPPGEVSANSNEDTVDSDNNGSPPLAEVSMDEYIQIFHELYKFFCMLGTVFGFVASDVKVKVEILSNYRKGPNGDHYESVRSMLLYERETGYLKENKNGNASRTFLRLHRALLFVFQFLGKTLTLADEEGTANTARETYNETLSKHHPWLIRKGALMAMYTLPIKKDLFTQLGVDKHFEPNEVTELLREGVRVTQEIYETCEKLYEEENLLNLP